MKTREIIIDEKDWFNIDEEIDPKLKVTDKEVLKGLRIDFVHEMLELYRAVKIWQKRCRREQRLGNKESVPFDSFYEDYLKKMSKYPRHQLVEELDEEDEVLDNYVVD